MRRDAQLPSIKDEACRTLNRETAYNRGRLYRRLDLRIAALSLGQPKMYAAGRNKRSGRTERIASPQEYNSD